MADLGVKFGKDVRIIVTGGTLDKVHDVQTEGLAFSSDGTTHLPEMLKIGRCYFPAVQLLMLKDSLYFDDADRDAIAAAVAGADEQAIVITHGTGTMGETARFLADHVGEKTVVLTGAMRPFSLSSSDGEFNLGSAIVAAQLLEAGVWGAMNGRVFPATQLNKNVEQGRFDA
ncbi:Asparaginase [Sulfitobacter noctilucae]|uniref:asparaginase domain-containing protein n=1 Tax=Sulfitobacter noctilucae TaxID=1342302 RepID=UPI000468FD1A|nr:asparaginase domain-containing protein [Sulfitobacter noctilucae]KIN60055.1 Asparaginase [Sulfitobacter noctilucae]